MSSTRQTILASRPAAMILASALVVGLTVPVLMLPRAHATPAPTLPCAEINNNGCTELSPTPPQDTEAVPPNIVLMLDDSGSMAWDFMPDWDFLGDGLPSGWNSGNNGVRDSAVNSLYYNPTTVYTPPPKADSTATSPDMYPPSPSITGAFTDGFTDATHFTNITSYGGDPADTDDEGNPTTFAYYAWLYTTQVTDFGPAVEACPSGYSDPTGTGECTKPPVAPSTTTTWKCVPPPSGLHGPTGRSGYSGEWCYTITGSEPPVKTWYPATKMTVTGCPSGTTGPDSSGLCDYPPRTPTWQCPSGGSPNGASPIPECVTRLQERVFTYTLGAPGSYTLHYVAAGSYTLNKNSAGYVTSIGGSDCSIVSNITQKANCVNADDTSGAASPATDAAGNPLSAGQNIANWFSYYRTRILMAKSGLMTAFSNLNPKYRFGFASINGNDAGNPIGSYPNNIPSPTYAFDDSCGWYCGYSSNSMAEVQPFGDGTAGTQKAKFWNWIANESASGGTPLRKALQAVGEYYSASDSSSPAGNAWDTMSTDPGYTAGSTTQFACRASYAILTTDGFWNGTDPSGIGYAAGTNGPVQSVPSTDTTTQYLAVPPYSGGGVGGTVPSLADVATYYWENDLSSMPNEVATSTSDPAAWQHMTTFTIGLGFKPVGISGTNSSGQPATVPDIFTWANGGAPITGFGWPTPASNSIYNIADLAHAAVNGHGEFFNVTKPEDLANALDKAFSDIAARTDTSPTAAVNASTLSLGALSFSTGYETKYWSGTFHAVTLNADGTLGSVKWDAGNNLNSDFHSATGYPSRNVWTDAYNPTGTPAFAAFQFDTANEASLDATETAGLGGNTDCSAAGDTICNRIDYLLGDPTHEGGMYRARTLGILGAIIRSQPLYVAAAVADYYNDWPTGSPELAPAAQTYDAFMTQESTRPGMVYVGANDGMLHAFDAPVPTDCTYSGSPPSPTCNYNPDGTAGNERWAFIPRAVYANLGNLTDPDFHFLPTVNETPVSRDVFFGQSGEAPTDNKWHTILLGGVGMGGRGVYALDITSPASFSASDVLWEFDSDSSVAGCTSIVGTEGVSGTCSASDLGYTISEPNIGRINYDNKWVALVPNGYFPDCTTPDMPTATIASCETIANRAPGYLTGAPYSALFVLDAETGSVIAELKTPQITGVTSFGLATPVMGDYLGNQVDTVAFAGDVEGNLWRFDLSDPSPSNWKVTLVYQAPVQGAQPITTMPRLFPDPATNRFMIVFGTGKYLGIGDNNDKAVQAIYGVRDPGDCSTDAGCAVTQSNLTEQYLHEETPTSGPYTDISLRCITGSASDTSCTTSPTPVNNVPSSGAGSGGWFINLCTVVSGSSPCGTSGAIQNDSGERVVATPAAIFNTDTVVVETLITGAKNTDPCNPSTQGSILALNVLSGGTSGVSSLGGGLIAGSRITNAQTSGSLPILSQVGGVRAFVGGAGAPLGNGGGLDIPMYRRRSWQEINPNQ